MAKAAKKKKKAKAKAKPKKASKKLAKQTAKKAGKKTAKKKAPAKAAKKASGKSAKKARKAAKKAAKRAAKTPLQPVMRHGVFCHVEIPSANLDAAKQFYSDVFGWTFQDIPMEGGSYTFYQTREGGIGGGMMSPQPGMPRQVVNYVLVDEIEPILDLVRSRGGQALTTTMQVGEYGWMAHFMDPEGNLFGLWKPATGGPQ